MNISHKTRLHDLLKDYPFLLDFLIGLSPKFAKLKNPVMRRTIGRMANLGQVASLGDMPVDKLLQEIASEVKRVKKEDVLVERAEGGEKQFTTREERLEVLKDIIQDLHQGSNLEDLRKRFNELINDVSPSEISEMEQQLIKEGMPIEEVMRLCDVHVQVFKGSLEGQALPQSIPGHPIHTLSEENKALEKIISGIKNLFKIIGSPPDAANFNRVKEKLKSELEKLSELEKHYLKKENQLFPLLEAKGASGPSQVMWAAHDEIRADLREFRRLLEENKVAEVVALGGKLFTGISDMIYKEEKILFPMSLETLDDKDWARVKRGEEEVGYAWIKPGSEWKPSVKSSEEELQMPESKKLSQKLELETGAMTPGAVNLVLTHLPVDITFVDENDTVAYFSQTKERIFPRSPAIIGRRVQNCHPPASVHVVNKILEAFRTGKRDSAEFWIQLSGKFIHIRYFAVREKEGKYKGCLEVSQDVTAIRALEGQKRLLDWE